jgi:ABC-2 type transport system permease protein
MTFGDTIRHEWRTTLSRPAGLVSVLLLACMFAYGAFNGRVERSTRTDAIAAHEAEVAVSQSAWLEQLKAIEERGPGPGVPPWAGSAMDVTLASSFPPAPLADFAIGQSDLLPHVSAVSLWDPDVRLFARYEFDDPVSLALGAFDLGAAVILVLPLLLIFLSFDALSAERDSGRLVLLVAQGAHMRRLIWSRLSLRAATVLAPMFLVSCIALVLPVGTATLPERVPFFGIWMLAALLYGGVWVGLISFVVSANKGGAVNLTALLLAWAGLTFLLPGSIVALAEAAYPMPSRLAYLADARETEIETELEEADVGTRFVLDHPDLVVDKASQMPGYVRTAFLATRSVDEATRPTLASFESAASKRERSMRFMRYLSPAIAVHGVLVDVAGSSAQRYRQFAAETRALKAGYADLAGRSIVAGRRLPLAQAATLPRLSLPHETASAVLRRNVAALGFLAVVAAVLALAANRRLGAMERGGN